MGIGPIRPEQWTEETEPTQILAAKQHDDGSLEMRLDTVVRDKPKAGAPRGRVNVEKSKKQARKMVNNGAGQRLRAKASTSKGKTAAEVREEHAQQMLRMVGEDLTEAITVNLLARSGLTGNRVARDLNLLEASLTEAAHHLRQDQLRPALDKHFGLDHLDSEKRKDQADGCTIAALLMMNAAMLHQRIAAGQWLANIEGLEHIKNAPNVVTRLLQNWERITRMDFLPVIEPAREAVYAVQNTGKLGGLEQALRHLASEAEHIASTYADMGADHAGPLFNKVMGNQASDGAYFTRPPAASIAAKLALDVCGDQNWRDPAVWREHKTVDLACGSGTLLAALLTDLKRRASEQGASPEELAELQKLAVEDVIKGLDINPVSLQLAASQLTQGNHAIRYRKMGLHKMPYGPQDDPAAPVAAGTLELLTQKQILAPSQTRLFDETLKSQAIRTSLRDPVLEDAVDAVQGTRIIMMNPPFTNRTKMGEKFPEHIQRGLRVRVDKLEEQLVAADERLSEFVDKSSLGPSFVSLAVRCMVHADGLIVMIRPTIALASVSGIRERRLLAERFHVHTLLTCHQPGNVNLSQNTSTSQSIILLRRLSSGAGKPPTRVISVDRLPENDLEVAKLHAALLSKQMGQLDDGWGEVSHWPVERVAVGDWTGAIWRSPGLAEASATFAQHDALRPLSDLGFCAHDTGRELRGSYVPSSSTSYGAFPILKGTGEEAQKRIEAVPNEDRCWTEQGSPPILAKASHLLVSSGQDTGSARLTALASERKYVGNGWIPVSGVSVETACALAVFLNSTVGRLLVMRSPGRKLTFPQYSVSMAAQLSVPDMNNDHIRSTLADCWEATRHMIVPQFRDGECEVRRLWDEAVCEALGWNQDEIAHLRHLLHREPHVSGLGYGQYADEPPDTY